jgi:hypothetical protein
MPFEHHRSPCLEVDIGLAGPQLLPRERKEDPRELKLNPNTIKQDRVKLLICIRRLVLSASSETFPVRPL